MSQVPALMDALVARWTADLTPQGVRVTDGPVVTEDRHPDWATVGYDGNQSGDFQAASTEQVWSALGTSREERIRLTAAVVVRRGDSDMAAARRRAYEILDLLVASLKADPSAGLRSAQVAIGASVLHLEPTTGGACARIALVVDAVTFV